MADMKSKTRKLIPLKYSCEEVYERMENGLCIFCEEKDSPEHQKLKHKGIQIVCVEDEQMSDTEETSPPKAIEKPPLASLDHSSDYDMSLQEVESTHKINLSQKEEMILVKKASGMESPVKRVDDWPQQLSNDMKNNDACQVFDKMSLNAQPHESDLSSVIMPRVPPIPLQPPDPPDFSRFGHISTMNEQSTSTTIEVIQSSIYQMEAAVPRLVYCGPEPIRFSVSSHSQANSPLNHHTNSISLVSQHLSLILKEIDSSQRKLAQMEKQMLGYESIDISRPNIVPELKLFLQRNQLPLGKDSRTGTTEMVSSVGHSCEKSADLLSQYMSYKVFDRCPDDWSLGQKLILRACEPLPRRRCLAKTVQKKDLTRFPDSLWRTVSNKSINWSGLGCKSFDGLKGKKISQNCVSCFDLGNEKDRFVKVKGKNDFLVDECVARFFEELDYINQRSVRETRFNDDAGDVSSMKIAELAGDLLDVKWSTNIYIWMSMKGGIEKGSLQILVDSNSILETPLVTSPTLRFVVEKEIDDENEISLENSMKNSNVYEYLEKQSFSSKRPRDPGRINKRHYLQFKVISCIKKLQGTRSFLLRIFWVARFNAYGTELQICNYLAGFDAYDVSFIQRPAEIVDNDVKGSRNAPILDSRFSCCQEDKESSPVETKIFGISNQINSYGETFLMALLTIVGNLTLLSATHIIVAERNDVQTYMKNSMKNSNVYEATKDAHAVCVLWRSKVVFIRTGQVSAVKKALNMVSNCLYKWRGSSMSIMETNHNTITGVKAIEESKSFYRCLVEKSVKLLMNVPFTLEKSEQGVGKLEAEFIKEAAKENVMQFEGHRSVGEFSECHEQSATYCVSTESTTRVKLVFTVLVLWKEEPPDNIIL